jgi:hypothetical protein
VPFLTVTVTSLLWADSSVSHASHTNSVERRWLDNVNPVPTETSLGASSVLLLADSVRCVSNTLSLPDSALGSVIERWNDDISDFLGLKLPGETSLSADFVHLLAVTVTSLLSADL